MSFETEIFYGCYKETQKWIYDQFGMSETFKAENLFESKITAEWILKATNFIYFYGNQAILLIFQYFDM